MQRTGHRIRLPEPSTIDNVQAIGLAHRCAAVRAIGIPIERLADEPARTVRRLVEEGRRTLEAGADVLIPGCFGFSLLECAPRVSAQLGVPVVYPLIVSVKTAEALVAGGYRVSRRTYPASDLTPLQEDQWFRSFQTAEKDGSGPVTSSGRACLDGIRGACARGCACPHRGRLHGAARRAVHRG